MLRELAVSIVALGVWCGLGEHGRCAELEVHEFSSTVLKANPLGDPAIRKLAVLVPNGTRPDAALGLVVYLPGWGGSSADVIREGAQGWLGQVVDGMAAKGVKLRLAVVDGRSRFGGSQFLNSSATGQYGEYVAQELLAFLKLRYQVTPDRCWIAGHSSGGYGALMLAMEHQADFTAVVALSPDSDFEVTHKPLVQQAAVRAVSARELAAAMAPAGEYQLPPRGLATLVLGLCANYAGIAAAPGRFEWLYSATGEWRPEAWKRWLELDPLTVVTQGPRAFAESQRVYLDGAEHDEYGANIGARKIHEVLRKRASPVKFVETPGHHSDRLGERLMDGLSWAGGGGR